MAGLPEGLEGEGEGLGMIIVLTIPAVLTVHAATDAEQTRSPSLRRHTRTRANRFMHARTYTDGARAHWYTYTLTPTHTRARAH